MFKAIIKTQWKWTRVAVLACVAAAFGLPLLSLASASEATEPRGFIAAMQAWGMGYALLAAALGLLVAVLAWNSDHRGHHVYALSLPVPRWRYVLLRFGAGLLFLLPPVLALGISALIVSGNRAIPAGLHSYPFALTLRFAFAAMVAFAVFFAISAATKRAAGYVLGIIGLVVVAEVLTTAAGLQAQVLARAIELIIASPGLLSVFNGRWMLIDV
jgi:hypothetical protein